MVLESIARATGIRPRRKAAAGPDILRRLLVRRFKTDQRGVGQEIAVRANPGEPAFRPVAALEASLGFRRRAADITGGVSDREMALFVGMSKAGRLSDKAVWRLVRKVAVDAGLESWARFSGHSLRVGLATAAGEAGADLAQVMRQTRHRSTDVALGYLRPADLSRNNPTRGIWTAGRDRDAGQDRPSRGLSCPCATQCGGSLGSFRVGAGPDGTHLIRASGRRGRR